MSRAALLLPAAAALLTAALVLACGGDGNKPVVTAPTATGVATQLGETPTAATDRTPGAAPRIEIAALNNTFDKSELAAPAGQSFTVAFDNQDDGIPHNFALYRDQDFDDEIAGSEIENGPLVQGLAVPALEPGTYYFQCDAHPNLMEGELIAQ